MTGETDPRSKTDELTSITPSGSIPGAPVDSYSPGFPEFGPFL